MAYIGLDRADPAGIALRSYSSKHPAQGSAFDGVANAGAGAVRLDIDDRCGVDVGFAVDLAEQGFLRSRVRHRQAGRAAVRVYARTGNDGHYRVPLSQRLRQRLQHDHRAALRADVTVACRIEG